MGATSARAARRGAAFCLARHTLRLSRARAATGRAAALHPHGHQIRTGVRCFSQLLLLYFAAVRAPGTVGSGFRIMLLNWGGVMGIRTPDLLHAMQWQHVHRSPSVQVAVSGRPHQSPGIQACCCTFVLYRSRQPTGDTSGPTTAVQAMAAQHPMLGFEEHE